LGAACRSWRSIPSDARDKPGSGGQFIAFVPSLDLVITRQTGSSGGWAYEEYLRRAVRRCCRARQEASERPPVKRYFILFLLALLSVITYLDRLCIAVAGPSMQKDLGLDRSSGGCWERLP
jgi:hypothetical protein